MAEQAGPSPIEDPGQSEAQTAPSASARGKRLESPPPGNTLNGRRRSALIGSIVALGVACGLVAYLLVPGGPKPPAAHNGISMVTQGLGKGLPERATGSVAPSFTLPRLGGGPPVSLSGARGHPVILNFFASWCTNCRTELRAFADVSNANHSPVRFLAVDAGESSGGAALRLLSAAGDHYPVGLDAQASVAVSRYLVEALPTTVFIGANGRIEGQTFGAETASLLRSWVHRLTSGSAKADMGGQGAGGTQTGRT